METIDINSENVNFARTKIDIRTMAILRYDTNILNYGAWEVE